MYSSHSCFYKAERLVCHQFIPSFPWLPHLRTPAAKMNSQFVSTVTKALLPSAPRQCQFRIPAFRTVRPFSSSPKVQSITRELERRLLGTDVSQPAKETTASLSAVKRLFPQGDKQTMSPPLNGNYLEMVDSLQNEVTKTPYAEQVPPHHLHVYAHKHNTLLTLTRPNGNPMMSMGCGRLGFRKGGRSGYDPAYQLASHVFAQIQEKGWLLDIKRLALIYRGFGPGREAFTKVLLGNEGKNIRGLVCRVTDSTRIKFGGTRSREVRRLG